MNYYERHIGDYIKDTAHLSLLEHGVYGRLLDVYYTRECGIDAGTAARLIGVRSKDERNALSSVMDEFFVLDGAVWTHRRCDKEIARYQDKQRKASASANARWTKQSTHTESTADAMRTHSEGNAPSNQTPVTSNQERDMSAEPTRKPSIPCPYSEIVALYHSKLPSLPAVRVMSPSRQRALRHLWGFVLGSTKSDGTRRATNADEALEWLGGYFARASENDFLMGKTSRPPEHAGWQCDLDFLCGDKGITQVIEKTRVAA